MDLEDLNRDVTDAIVHAESLPTDSPEAREAFREVGRLEEAIAQLTPADDVEGEIARLGAVTAALSAGDPLRALWLADRFLADGVAPEITEKLGALATEADADLARSASDEPRVEHVTFTIHVAA